MTVVVVCGAGCPDGTAFTRSGDNKSRSPVPLRGLPAPLLDISPLFSRGQGRLRVELFTSQLSVWKRLQMLLCFSFFLLLLGAARAFARPVFKALDEKGEKEWPLNCLFLFLPRQPKVQSKQAEVNGIIFSFSVAFCVRLQAPPFCSLPHNYFHLFYCIVESDKLMCFIYKNTAFLLSF